MRRALCGKILFFALIAITELFSWNAVALPAVVHGVDAELNLRVEAIRIVIMNPSNDMQLNARVEDSVRSIVGVFPSASFSTEVLEFNLARARRSANIADITYSIQFGPTGGIILDLSVTLGEGAVIRIPRGMLAKEGKSADFPILYDGYGTYLKLKLEGLAMYYSNVNAWYGQPDSMLAGNPLVDGEPAGAGYQQWGEGFVHTGIYGITPIADTLYTYGGASVIASGSAGHELFTDKTRGYIGTEDAFVGVVTGKATETGNRFVFNASIGRQRFKIGDGFLIINTASNGSDRAALQSNPRWAADMLSLVQLKYNDTQIDLFEVDPDELPKVDSQTVIRGINLESRIDFGFDMGLTYLWVPKSTFGYFTPTDTFSREGLRVYDARFRWQPNSPDRFGPFFLGEFAIQNNQNFPMNAHAFYGEAGYFFADGVWTPTASYRFSKFTGDDPETSSFERWDPLLSGGTGEQWVQGINHFKIFQNSNLIAHRFQMRMRLSPRVELVPQFWIFRADSKTNYGGNPALSSLSSKDLGTEINLTGKVFMSRQTYVQGHLAATFPGDAVKESIAGEVRPWLSAMLFLRVAY